MKIITTKLHQHWKLVAATGVSLGVAGSALLAQDVPPPQPEQQPGQDIQQELQQIQGQLQEVTQRLIAIQEQAFERDDIVEARNEFQDLISEKMLEAAPELEEQIERQREITDELDEMDRTADAEEYQRLETEYQQVQQELAPVEQQLVQDQDLMESRDEFNTTLMAAMNEIDDATDRLLDEYEQLQQEFAMLQQQLMQQQQPQQQAPQQAPQQEPQQQAPQQP